MSKTIIEAIRERMAAEKPRSAWSKGVMVYASEFVDELDDDVRRGLFHDYSLRSAWFLRKSLLRGACDWKQYSWGGCSLIYDGDVARRLCSPSELRRTRGGKRRPNAREEWLDTQARALYQACDTILRFVSEIVREEGAA